MYLANLSCETRACSKKRQVTFLLKQSPSQLPTCFNINWCLAIQLAPGVVQGLDIDKLVQCMQYKCAQSIIPKVVCVWGGGITVQVKVKRASAT